MALTALVRLLFGGSFTDLCYGYMAFWRHWLPVLHLDADGFEIETLMSVRALTGRLKVVETHSYEAKRLYGESHLKAIPDGFRVLATILKERFTPNRVRTVVTNARQVRSMANVGNQQAKNLTHFGLQSVED